VGHKLDASGSGPGAPGGRENKDMRKLVIAAVILVVAAALIAVAVAAVALFSGSAGPSATVLAIESPIVTGEVTIDARTWGTAVHLELEGLPQRDRYVAWVVDDGGNRQQAATWGPTPTGAARLDGASSTPTNRVTAVVVTDATGDETLLTAING